MYNFLKRKVKVLVPEKLLFRNEISLRSIHGFFYKGNKHQCNICSKHLSSFVNLKNNELLCPFCGSLSRNRRLWRLLKNQDAIKGNILHFSPSRNLFRKFNKIDRIKYYSTDFEGKFIADHGFDITNIKKTDDYFDVIICYHILEHIEDDKKAMSELFRVLKPEGKAFIQTPFKEEEIYEDASITSPEEREKQFGQHDHVRIYSIDGLKKRLLNAGFKVIVKNFENDEMDNFYGFRPETILILTK